jgi:hypothetical protein
MKRSKEPQGTDVQKPVKGKPVRDRLSLSRFNESP